MVRLKVCFSMGLAAAAVASQAVILTPDVYTDLPGITTIPGTVIADVVKPFSFSAYGGTVSGSVQSRVTRKDNGTLLFEWRMISDDNSSGAIQDLRLGGFLTSVYDADWESAGLGDTNPTRGLLFSAPGGFVNFNFNQATNPGGVLPGHSSFFFFLDTDATEFGEVALYDLTNLGQSEISGPYSTFAPVPEPATLAVLSVGALALIRKRRMR
jgi:hypothetical protein